MTPTRTYTMTARAAAAERTRLRILEATVTLATTRLLADISLADMASEAGVSVQTVLRRFGSRAGVIAAAHAHAAAEVAREREATVGDVTGALTVLVDHYELRGDGVVLLLAQEGSDEQVRRITSAGRGLHRNWVETVLAPYLSAAADRDELIDLLVVATDVLTWKQLRRDLGLNRSTTERRMHRLVTALLPRTAG
jgi:AcrR family transcriptional regulator